MICFMIKNYLNKEQEQEQDHFSLSFLGQKLYFERKNDG